MSEIATGNRDDALDLVQDAMIKLVEKYAHRCTDDWGPLFYRILQSRIVDWHRRKKVRRSVMGFFRIEAGQQIPADGVEHYPDIKARQPEERTHTDQLMERLEPALHALPPRQQQAFLLRLWEGLDVNQTALAMGCSASSVKTHYSRALRSLRTKLDRGDGHGHEID